MFSELCRETLRKAAVCYSSGRSASPSPSPSPPNSPPSSPAKEPKPNYSNQKKNQANDDTTCRRNCPASPAKEYETECFDPTVLLFFLLVLFILRKNNTVGWTSGTIVVCCMQKEAHDANGLFSKKIATRGGPVLQGCSRRAFSFFFGTWTPRGTVTRRRYHFARISNVRGFYGRLVSVRGRRY